MRAVDGWWKAIMTLETKEWSQWVNIFLILFPSLANGVTGKENCLYFMSSSFPTTFCGTMVDSEHKVEVV